MATEYSIEFDERKCVACYGCTVACKSWREVPLGLSWRRIEKLWYGTFPKVTLKHASVNCQHCVQPACVAACPAGALSKSKADGLVSVNPDTCIGCKACAEACPFDVPVFGADETMQKCDLCSGRLGKKGEEPPCVGTCPTRALAYKQIDTTQKARAEKKLLQLLQGNNA